MINKHKTPYKKGVLERQWAFQEESCSDYSDAQDDTLHLHNAIVGLIIDNDQKETHVNEVDTNVLSCENNGVQSSEITIRHPIERITGGKEATRSWETTKQDDRMDTCDENENAFHLLLSGDSSTKFEKRCKLARSESFSVLDREKEFFVERGSNLSIREKDYLLSKRKDGTIAPESDNSENTGEHSSHCCGSDKNTFTFIEHLDWEIPTEARSDIHNTSPDNMDIMRNDNSSDHKAGTRNSFGEPVGKIKENEAVLESIILQYNTKAIHIPEAKMPDENPDILTSGTSFPKKRNYVKLAMTTSHAGIYVTGESQDDTSSDSWIESSFERCPSRIGKQCNDSSLLSPYFQPSSNESSEESPAVISVQKPKVPPILLSSTQQNSNSFEKDMDSYTSLSAHSKASGFSVRDSGFEALGRHTTALLSPSFRKMTSLPTSHQCNATTPGGIYSSADYSLCNTEDGASNHSLNNESKQARRRRKVAIGSSEKISNNLLSPALKARSYDKSEKKSHKISHQFLVSNSSGDSGLETSQNIAFHSLVYLQKDKISTPSIISSRDPRNRSSQFSIQRKLSKSSMKSDGSFTRFSNQTDSFKGSFLSFLSPKNLFSSRKSSDGGRSSCGSKSSRKQLADFPDDEKILVINVSGRKFKLHEYFTTVYPETLLGSTRRNEFYDAKKDEFFFDRDPDIFRHIWNFYYTEKLHFPKDECVSLFVDEISFFGVADEYLCTCCWEDEFEPAMEKLEKFRTEMERKKQERLVKNRKIPKDASLREKLWLTIDDPGISTQAKVFYSFSMLAVVISVIACITETIPCSRTLHICKEHNQELYFYIDSACVTFFTIEYLLRLISAPKRLLFVRNLMSIVDLLAILPYYCNVLLQQIFGASFVSGINLLEILKTIRIVRVFKLLKNSHRLQSLVNTFKSSTTELGLIVFIYLVLVTVFASIIYYAEMQDNPKYSSIPESMWYAVITTTTTGYGDIVPETILGKLIGCACCLLGVLVVALPVPILQIR